ncbi:hypothetical protein BX666DRAFT_1897633 [Dichotomocladium elegans]|nr:hypothetical protein BX666DRAFT_1897633 [Dichotomocladium elegans]
MFHSSLTKEIAALGIRPASPFHPHFLIQYGITQEDFIAVSFSSTSATKVCQSNQVLLPLVR